MIALEQVEKSYASGEGPVQALSGVSFTLGEGAGLTATAQDIEENPLKLQLVELEGAILPRSLADLDIGVINGNYALEGDVVDRLLVSESADSQAAKTR